MLRSQQSGILKVFAVATIVTLIEIVTHLALLEPLETPVYYVAIFLAAALATVLMLSVSDVVALFVGAFLFMVFKIIYYLAAYYIGSPLLSCCLYNPIHVIGVNDVVLYQFGYYAITTSVLLEATIIHYLVYSLGYIVTVLSLQLSHRHTM